MVDACIYVTAYTMDANEAQEEYEEVQTELRKKEEEVSCLLSFVVYVTYMYNDWEGNKEFCLKTESLQLMDGFSCWTSRGHENMT